MSAERRRSLALAASVALSLFSIGMLLASAGRIPAVVALGGAVLIASLTVWGLPSLGAHRSALILQGVAALGMVRGLAVPGSDPSWVLPWAVGAVATLVLALGGGGEARLPGAPAQESRRSWRAVAVVSAIVVLATLLLGPLAASREPYNGVTNGGQPARSSDVSLLDQTSLDMTVNPKLSNSVVMTVRSPQPSFWRGDVFDTWNGNTWTRSDGQIEVSAPPSAGTVGIIAAPDDLGARGGQSLQQTFHIVAPAANIIFAAPSPVAVRSDAAIAQRADGTVVSSTMGPGATYTVISRRAVVTDATLAAAHGPIPARVLKLYAARPVATKRTVAAAVSVTRGQTTELGKVQALEAWMGRTTKYSISAPPSRKGVDVVDDFLFHTKRGWCEQIATSLVVLLRSIGVPARLATGFITGDPNPLTDVYTVRGKDAHAWAEVWFPGIGWQTFDPTAHVPLSGDATHRSAFSWLRSHVWVVLGLMAMLGLAEALRRLLQRSPRPWRRFARSSAAGSWARATLRRLERLGAKRGRQREPHETATAYGGILAELTGERGLADVGRLVDDDTYRPEPVPPADQAAADRVLERAEALSR